MAILCLGFFVAPLCGGGTLASPEEVVISLPPEGAAPEAVPEASPAASLPEGEVIHAESVLGGVGGRLGTYGIGLGVMKTAHVQAAGEDTEDVEQGDELCASVTAGGMLELRGPRVQPQEWCNSITNHTDCERAYVRQTQTVWPCEWVHDPSKRRKTDTPCQTFGGAHLCPSLPPLEDAVASDDGCTDAYADCTETRCCKNPQPYATHHFSCLRRPDRYYAQCRPAHAPGADAIAFSCRDSPEWLCPGWEKCAQNYAECTRSRCCAGIEFGCYLDINDTSGWHAYCRPKAEMEQATNNHVENSGWGGDGSGSADLRWLAVANATNEDGTWAWVIVRVGEKAHELHQRIVTQVKASSPEAIAAIVVSATLVAACALCCALRYRHRMLGELERLEEKLATLQKHGIARATRDEGEGLMADDPESGVGGAADGLGGTELVDGTLAWERYQPQKEEAASTSTPGEEEPAPAPAPAPENSTPPAATTDEPPPWWPAATNKNGH